MARAREFTLEDLVVLIGRSAMVCGCDRSQSWVVIRVKPEFRRGRGRYWRVGGWGYTDDLEHAGVFPPGWYPAGRLEKHTRGGSVAYAEEVPLEEEEALCELWGDDADQS